MKSGAHDLVQELRILTMSGQQRWIENRIHITYNAEQLATSFQAIAIDITARKQTDEQLKITQHSVEQANDSIFWLLSDARIAYANRTACQILGYTRDELQSMTVFDIEPKSMDDADISQRRMEWQQAWERLKDTDGTSFETIHQAKDGTRIPVEVRCNFQVIDGQEYMFAFVRDLTKSKAMEARMRAQDELAHMIQFSINSAPQAIFWVNRDGYILNVNDGASRMLGYTRNEFLSMNIRALDHTFQPSNADVWRRFSEQGNMTIEAALEHCDGYFIPVEIQLNYLEYRGQEFQFAFASDIRERKEAEEERRRLNEILRQSEKQLREVLGSLLTPICIVRTDGTYLYANESYSQILGISTEILIHKTNARAIYVEVDARQQLLAKLAKEGQVNDFKVHLKKADGSTFWASTSVYSLNYDGELVLLSSVYDLTEQMRTEQILRDAKEAAEAANRTKSLFLSNMTHELRTPMNGVLGMTTLLLDTPLDDEQRDIVNTIRFSGDTLLTIINDVLDFSKIEANKLDLEQVPFELASTIHDTTQLVRPTVDAKGLRLTYQIEKHLPTWIHQDVTRLRQILTNLISNAVKFTEKGSVHIQVSAYTSAESQTSSPMLHRQITSTSKQARSPLKHRAWKQPSGELIQLHFSVQDSGIGIPQERLPHLFQPFSQVDASTTRRYGGTGLGLAISRQLCELMGGEMWVDSEVGKGTTFHFTMCAEPATAPANTSSEKSTDSAQSNEFEREMAIEHPLSILLVEDNVVNQKVALALLNRLGYTADVAANGLEAIDALKRQHYDVVLMDIQMPEMDGVTATKHIRARWSPKEQPIIIALTADAMEQQRTDYMDAGMDDYVTKPIRVAELVAALERVPDRPKAKLST